ncbi:MAG: tRNA (adenosine(37)-N6)-dimethylallyltransferase MiaA [Bacteroidota bacterium]|nr:tRNA (adenosine(37)-N6)-dimethylallyltransferase MiaA [Bacteroidota bacterium]
MEKTLIVILGPTGVGKTELSISIAEKYKTDIISCDSRQIYRQLRIGTAVPEPEYLQRINHHFIQCRNLDEYYNASMFECEVIDLLDHLFKTNDQVIMTGGSMLYIDAVCNGIDDLPTVTPEIRDNLLSRYQKEGLEPLCNELLKLDPVYYKEVDLRNHKRVLHALEICQMTGKPFSELRTRTIKERNFSTLKIGLNRDREELYQRINKRVIQMVNDGLVDEALAVLPYRNLNALNTVGYKEMFAYLDGLLTLDEAIDLIQRNTRKYARKQLTWFRRDQTVNWFNPDEPEKIISFLDLKINNSK